MPNGHQEERDAVWERSRLWGAIWQIGDTAYYLGFIASVIVPLAIVAVAIQLFESWWGLLQGFGWALLSLLTCFPLGFGVAVGLKAWARRRTGVLPK